MDNSKELNIFQRINEIRKKVEYLRKDKRVDNKYNVVSHDSVTAELRPYLIEFGVVVVPSMVSSRMHNDVIKYKNSTASRYEATYCFEFVNIDNPTDKTIIVMESHAVDAGDKSPGKAISYAMKYALLKMFNIETGEEESSSVSNRITTENAVQATYDDLVATAKQHGMTELERDWLALTEDDRKLLGTERLKVLKGFATEHDSK